MLSRRQTLPLELSLIKGIRQELWRLNSKMIIRDFEKQKIISPQQVATLVKALPTAHFKGLQSILYKPAREFLAMQIPIDPGCRGAYYPEYRSVVIHDLESRAMAAHIIYHEIGHYVYHVVIGSYVRKDWFSRIGGKPPFATEYAKRGAGEDFAECYALYCLKSAKLHSSSPKYQFLKQRVFKE